MELVSLNFDVSKIDYHVRYLSVDLNQEEELVFPEL